MCVVWAFEEEVLESSLGKVGAWDEIIPGLAWWGACGVSAVLESWGASG